MKRLEQNNSGQRSTILEIRTNKQKRTNLYRSRIGEAWEQRKKKIKKKENQFNLIQSRFESKMKIKKTTNFSMEKKRCLNACNSVKKMADSVANSNLEN